MVTKKNHLEYFKQSKLKFVFVKLVLESHNLFFRGNVSVMHEIIKLNEANLTWHLFPSQWPSGQGAGFPIQGSRVQNHWVAPRSTQPFILPRSVK